MRSLEELQRMRPGDTFEESGATITIDRYGCLKPDRFVPWKGGVSGARSWYVLTPWGGQVHRKDGATWFPQREAEELAERMNHKWQQSDRYERQRQKLGLAQA